MSVQITTAFVEQYKSNVFHLAQQKGSRLRDAARTETVTGNKLMSRVGETKSFDNHMDLNEWNSPVGTLREWLYNVKPDLGMLNHCGWLSVSAQRVSRYCIEGER